MHAMFKGAISFGLVSIPVKMFAATEEKDIRFRTLHKYGFSPVERDARAAPGRARGAASASYAGASTSAASRR